MSLSQRQLEANRRNALRSTGPRTEEGKARVSINAIRHGLCTQTAILPHEEPELFSELSADMHAQYDPQSLNEIRWVDELTMSYWRLRRFTEMEVAVLTPHYQAEPGVDADGAPNLKDPQALLNDMLRLSRYHSSIYRSRDRALKELASLQSNRFQQLQSQPEDAGSLEAYLDAPPPAGPVASAPIAKTPAHPTHPSQLPPHLASRWPRDRNRLPIKPNMNQKFWQNYFQQVAEAANQ